MNENQPDARPPMEGVADAPLPFEGGRQAASAGEIAFVRRRVLLLYLLAPALSAAALLAGFTQRWPALASAGAIGLGLTAIAAGVLAVAERRLVFLARGLAMSRTRHVLYEGAAAIPFGLSWIVAGATVVGAAIAFLSSGDAQALRRQVAERPGHALAPAGAFLLLHGLGLLVGFPRRPGTAGQRAASWLLELPTRLGGLLVAALGALVLAAGLYEWLRPAAFDRWLAEIARGRLPFGL